MRIHVPLAILEFSAINICASYCINAQANSGNITIMVLSTLAVSLLLLLAGFFYLGETIHKCFDVEKDRTFIKD